MTARRRRHSGKPGVAGRDGPGCGAGHPLAPQSGEHGGPMVDPLATTYATRAERTWSSVLSRHVPQVIVGARPWSAEISR